ncbi:SDR family oxidoreductase [Pontibacter sp. JH31]|uniref:SDR family oxidoreductase n=1 Tax=Pontibacter aquaedesilientis TaxID=2766980 RepID=A0ABR7XDG4_9BACT|nr:SDR family oxidoreductase [Pontibacter aquaedesilientis]MBD1396340.1 SDR family oxidoreductase [Pontibacter aquaedesilientis]
MKKILLAGATGQLGKYIFRELKLQGYDVRVLARNLKKAQALFPDPEELVLADATKRESLAGCCAGVKVVISAIGKNTSLRSQSHGSFLDIDYKANLNLLGEAQKAGVSQFIYISVYGADRYASLAYFKAHNDFENALRSSGISYTILQPVALFSALDELVYMARKGRVGFFGKGDKTVNPIYEGDVAKVAVSCIGQANQTLPLGGKLTYSRRELIHIACEAVGYSGRISEIPFELVEPLLPFVRLMSRSLYDKIAYMLAVSKDDCIAPAVGDHSLEEYFELESALLH